MLLNKLNAITVTNVHKNGDLYASKTKKVPFSFEEKQFVRLLTQDESSVSYFLEQKHEPLVLTVTQIRFPWCSK